VTYPKEFGASYDTTLSLNYVWNNLQSTEYTVLILHI